MSFVYKSFKRYVIWGQGKYLYRKPGSALRAKGFLVRLRVLHKGCRAP